MKYLVGVARPLITELCASCYEKISRRDAIVLIAEGDGDPGPYHTDCFEEAYGVEIKPEAYVSRETQ